MKKYIFLDFKRWFYNALKFIAVYILMVMLFMAYFYWYPEKEMNNMNRRALLTSSSCHPKIFVKEFSYFLMSCHQHCLGVNLLVQR